MTVGFLVGHEPGEHLVPGRDQLVDARELDCFHQLLKKNRRRRVKLDMFAQFPVSPSVSGELRVLYRTWLF